MDKEKIDFWELLLQITAISILLFIVFIIIVIVIRVKSEPSVEEQIKICRENGGIPNVYIDKSVSDHSQVVECSWEKIEK